MLYKNPQILREQSGNNAFAWEERTEKYNQSPTLHIPTLIEGDIEDIQIGEEIIFEEVENNVLKSCTGLKNFVRISPSYYPTIPLITIFDNHNHALYFWIDAVRRQILQPGFTLIHIDEHSDLWGNPHKLNLGKAIRNDGYCWDFTNLSCNVGNYIQPAIESGLVGSMIRIENESQIDEYMNHIPKSNTVLNLDLDIFAPELDFIPEEKKLRIIRNLLQKVNCVTIATSPFFIDQGIALQKLKEILENFLE